MEGKKEALARMDGGMPVGSEGDAGMENDGKGRTIKFRKPYRFEGKEYTELDLSGMEDLTGADMIAINKLIERAGSSEAGLEMTLEYAFYFAARASKLPVEFFLSLPPNEAARVKSRVINFLYGSD